MKEYRDNDGNVIRVENLEPCPFCGSDPELTFNGNQFTKHRSVIIKCGQCRASMKDSAIRNTHEWLLEKIISRWNARQNDH